MDLSIVKLLEEDEEVDSKHSEDDLQMFQDSLIRDIEGSFWTLKFICETVECIKTGKCL